MERLTSIGSGIAWALVIPAIIVVTIIFIRQGETERRNDFLTCFDDQLYIRDTLYDQNGRAFDLIVNYEDALNAARNCI